MYVELLLNNATGTSEVGVDLGDNSWKYSFTGFTFAPTSVIFIKIDENDISYDDNMTVSAVLVDNVGVGNDQTVLCVRTTQSGGYIFYGTGEVWAYKELKSITVTCTG
jgi:hypothetical protein